VDIDLGLGLNVTRVTMLRSPGLPAPGSRPLARLGLGEGVIGSLEPGKHGDLVVVRGPVSVPPEGLLGLRAELTMVGGEIIHRA